jgi:hypothetical protein
VLLKHGRVEGGPDHGQRDGLSVQTHRPSSARGEEGAGMELTITDQDKTGTFGKKKCIPWSFILSCWCPPACIDATGFWWSACHPAVRGVFESNDARMRVDMEAEAVMMMQGMQSMTKGVGTDLRWH